MRPLFGGDLTGPAQNATVSPATLMSCKMAGRAVTKVVHRCNDAKFTSNLDLSDCQLMQVPDAIYHLMRNLRLIQVNLARNVITKLPPKFPLKFSLITKLDMSQNKMRTLPDEFIECTELTTLDVSHNCFTYVPSCIFKLPSLRRLKANNNHITEIDTERLARKPLLVEIDLRDNPISAECRRALESASAPCNRSRLEVHLSPPPPELEGLDDLLADLVEDAPVPAPAAAPGAAVTPAPVPADDAVTNSSSADASNNAAAAAQVPVSGSIPPPPPMPPTLLWSNPQSRKSKNESHEEEPKKKKPNEG